MAWFLVGYGPYAWNEPWAGYGGRDFMDPSFHLDLARRIEKLGFDFLMIQDSSSIPWDYGDSHEAFLKWPLGAPKLDPTILVTLAMHATTRLGVVPTLATTEYPPYLLARLVSSLDHLSGGRAGWNIVTSGHKSAAMNYGGDEAIEHDRRYDMAEEFVDLVRQLWDSWEPDAVVLDRERHVFADHTKVHPIDFKGEYYSSRGPLCLPRSPQGHPVLVQAGGSERGKRYAAKYADAIVSFPRGLEAMKAYRGDIRRMAAEAGRNPDDIKVFYLLEPILGETDDEARHKNDRILARAADSVEYALAVMSQASGIDFSQFALDEPLPELPEHNVHRASIDRLRKGGLTLRELASKQMMTQGSLDMVGTPRAVAEQMGNAMEEVGGDGFLILSNNHLHRRYAAEVLDGLVPELHSRGLMRKTLESSLFKENLRAF
jgi:FMN-dependent oxidoreductase (nitrilotriacetate monooxygenase family)